MHSRSHLGTHRPFQLAVLPRVHLIYGFEVMLSRAQAVLSLIATHAGEGDLDLQFTSIEQASRIPTCL